MDGVAACRYAHFFRADPDQGAQIAGFELVCPHHFLLRFDQRLHIEGNRHLENLGRVEQPLRVLTQTENRCSINGFICAYALKNRHAVMQAMREHMQVGVTPVDELAVFPDFAVAVGHGHGLSPINSSMQSRDSSGFNASGGLLVRIVAYSLAIPTGRPDRRLSPDHDTPVPRRRASYRA